MRIRALELQRVGRYQGDVFSSLSDGLTVIYGPNEAGKSTMLGGIRGLLFGKVLLSDGIPNLGSGAFGRMMVETTEGQAVWLERSLSKKSPPKLLFSDGSTKSGQEVLIATLRELQEIEDTLFRSVYTFQLTDLVDKADKNDTLQARLYGFASQHQNPHLWERTLDEEAKKLFNKDGRAKNTQFLQIAKKLDSLSLQLEKTAELPEDYAKLLCSIDEYTQQISLENRQLSEIEQRLARAQLRADIYQLALPMWILQSEREAFGPLPAVDISAYSVKIETAQQNAQNAQQRLKHYRENEWASLVQARHRFVYNQALVDAGDVLRQWIHKAMEMNLQLKQRQHFYQVVQDAQSAMTSNRSRISPGWSDLAMENAKFPDATVQKIRSWNEQWQTIQQVDKDVKRQNAQRSLQIANEQICFDEKLDFEACKTLVSKNQIEWTSAKEVLVKEAELLDSWEKTINEIKRIEDRGIHKSDDHVEKSSNLAGSLTVASSLILVLSVIGALVAHADASVVLFYVLILGGVTGVFLSLRMRGKQREEKNPRLSEVPKDWERLLKEKQELEQLFSFLKPQAITSAEEVRLRAQVRDAHEQIERQRLQLANQATALHNWSQAKTEIDQNCVILEANAAARLEIQSEWRSSLASWLCVEVDAEVVQSMSFSDILADIPQILMWKHSKLAWQSAESNVRSLTAEIELFCDTWTTFFHHADLGSSAEAHSSETRWVSATTEDSLPQLFSSVFQTITQLNERVEEAEKSAQQAVEIDLQMENIKVRMAEADSASCEALMELNHLLNELDVQTVDEFSTTEKKLMHVQQLDEQISHRYHQIVGRCGGQKAFADEQLEQIRSVDEVWLREAVETAVAEHTRQKEVIQQIMNAKRDADLILQNAENSSVSLDLRWEIEQLKEEQRMLAKDWAKRVFARRLLQIARQTYETTHQSETLALAEQVFAEISDGRYHRLLSRTEEDGTLVLYAVDHAGQTWTTDKLSRGTREQIQLALRFSMIETYRQKGVDMPVILDDPLVNFDESRTRRYLQVFGRYATNGQVLLLTCHPHIRDFAVQEAGAQVVELCSVEGEMEGVPRGND
jgi:uncharacterized protein YhaN